MKKKIRSLVMAVAVILLIGISNAQINVQAAGSIFSGKNGVVISQSNTVVDSITYNGVTVEAIYRPYDGTNGTDSTYSCAAFVKKFYAQTQGVSVYNLLSTSSVPKVSSGGGGFVLTSTPKVGDIVRDNESVHWAIVKAVESDGRIVVIQQNAWYDGKAWVGAYTTRDNERYSYFTYDASANSIQFSAVTAEKQSDTVFKIQAELNDTYFVTTAGFYLGTSTSNMTKVDENVNTDAKYIYYTIGGGSGRWETLQEGTTYYYKFYATIGGKTYESGIYSFTTGSSGVSVSKFATPTAEKITDTSYKINGTLDGAYTVTTAGFYLGTSADNMTKVSEDVYADDIKYVYYTIGDGSKWWSTLQKGTTYYYKMYAVIGGIEYQSSVASFTTPSTALANCTVSLSSNSYTYDGSAKTPTVTVKNGAVTLTKGTHYTVSYSNNTNAGTATATITAVSGSGYSGSVSKTFTINKANQAVSASIGSSAITVAKTSTITASGKGTLSYSSSNPAVATVNASGVVTGISAGTATITVTAAGNSNYNPASKTISVTVNKIDISTCTVTLSPSEYTYDGNAKTPNVVVKNDAINLILTEGTHYTVSYSNNVNAGTATVTINAVSTSSYTGSVSKTFTIRAANIQFSSVTAEKQTDTSFEIKGVLNGQYLIDKAGFWIGTTTENMELVTQNVNGNLTEISYDLGDGSTWYDELERGKTYYYKMYVVIGGTWYQSGIKTFDIANAEGTTIVASGQCGYGVTWELNNEGTLTIRGTIGGSGWVDPCRPESGLNQPWYDWKDDIKKVSIENGVAHIGRDTFSDLSALEEVHITSEVKDIGINAFARCVKLKKLILSDSVETINVSAFSDCKSLEEVVLPENITSIAHMAFSNCTKLRKVVLPEGINAIGYDVFDGCSPDLVLWGYSSSLVEGYALREGLAFQSLGMASPIEGSIGAAAKWRFYNYEMQITGSGEVSSGEIGSMFSDYLPVKEIGVSEGVTKVTLYRLPFLETVVLPDSVTAVSFAACTGLENITLPERVEDISESGFQECSALTEINIPDKVKIINEATFRRCNSLLSVGLPSGLEAIGDYAFEDCTALTQIIIPDTVTYIGTRALGYQNGVACPEFRVIGVKGSQAEIYANENGLCFVDIQEVKIKAFAERLYTKALGRASDEAGVDFWTEMLVSEEYTAAQAAASFIFGPEFVGQNNSDEVFLDRLYATFFDRAADPSGKEYWLSYLQGGVTREYVTAQFVNSAEFEAVCAEYGMQRGSIGLSGYVNLNPNLTMYVVRCYREIHGRNADPDGLEYWCEMIVTKQRDATHVARSFVDSQEFIEKNLSNEDYLEVLYRAFMGRSSDSSGLAYWLGELEKGCTRMEVLDRFADCVEFDEILKSFGL